MTPWWIGFINGAVSVLGIEVIAAVLIFQILRLRDDRQSRESIDRIYHRHNRSLGEG